MGNDASNEQKSLRVATINYMGDERSPFQYYSQDYKFEEEKLSKVFKDNFEKWEYSELLKQGEGSKKISKLDAISKSRYSPLYNSKCGIADDRFMSKDSFITKWIEEFPKSQLRGELIKKLDNDQFFDLMKENLDDGEFFDPTKKDKLINAQKQAKDDMTRFCLFLIGEIRKQYKTRPKVEDFKDILIDEYIKCFEKLEGQCEHNILEHFEKINYRTKLHVHHETQKEEQKEMTIFFEFFYCLLIFKDLSEETTMVKSKFEISQPLDKAQPEKKYQENFQEKEMSEKENENKKEIWDLLQQRKILREFDFLAYLSIVEYVVSKGSFMSNNEHKIKELSKVEVFKRKEKQQELHDRAIKEDHIIGYKKFMKIFFGKPLLNEELKISKIILFLKDKELDVFFILSASEKLCNYLEKNEKNYRFIKDHQAKQEQFSYKEDQMHGTVCNLIVYKVSSFSNKAKKGNIKFKHAQSDIELQNSKFLSTEEWGNFSIVSVDNYIFISSKADRGREKLEKDLKLLRSKFPKKYLIFGGMIEPLSETKIFDEIGKVEKDINEINKFVKNGYVIIKKFLKSEFAKKIGEFAKKIGEEAKKTDKEAKKIGESAKKIDEEAKKIGESAKKIDESAKKIGESAKETVEEAKRIVEEAKKIGESAKEIVEEAKRIGESAKKIDESAKNIDEEAKKIDEEAKNIDENSKEKINFEYFSELKNILMKYDKESWKKKFREWKEDQKYLIFENIMMLAKFYFGKDSIDWDLKLEKYRRETRSYEKRKKQKDNKEKNGEMSQNFKQIKLGYPLECEYFEYEEEEEKQTISLAYPLKKESKELYEWFYGASIGLREITQRMATEIEKEDNESLKKFIFDEVLKEWEEILAKDKEEYENKKKYTFREGWDAGSSIKSVEDKDKNETIADKTKVKDSIINKDDHTLKLSFQEQYEKESFEYFVGFYNWFKINKICAFQKHFKKKSLMDVFEEWVYKDVETKEGEDSEEYKEWKLIEIKKAFGEILIKNKNEINEINKDKIEKENKEEKEKENKDNDKIIKEKQKQSEKTKLYFEIRRKILTKWSYDYTLFPNFVQKEVTSCKKRTYLQLQINKANKVSMEMRHYILFDSRLEGKDIFKDIFAKRVDEELDDGSEIEEEGEEEMNQKRKEHIDGTYMFGYSIDDRESLYKSAENRFVNDHYPVSPTEKHPFDNLFVMKTLTIPKRKKRQDNQALLKELGFESVSSEEEDIQ